MIEGPSLDISEDLEGGGEIVDKSIFCKMGLLIGPASDMVYIHQSIYQRCITLLLQL